jgi:hypothetical protein
VPPSPGALESVALGCPGLPISLWPICLLPWAPVLSGPPREDTQDLYRAGVGTGTALLLPLSTLKRYPSTHLPLEPGLHCPCPHPHVCCTGFLSFLLFILSLSQELRACVASAASGYSLWSGVPGSRTQDPGSWTRPQEGYWGLQGPRSPPFLFPASLHPSHTYSLSRPTAVGS